MFLSSPLLARKLRYSEIFDFQGAEALYHRSTRPGREVGEGCVRWLFSGQPLRFLPQYGHAHDPSE